MQMQFWIIQTLNSVAFGGLLFLLSSGFSLDLRPDAHSEPRARRASSCSAPISAARLHVFGGNFWLAALGAGLGVGLIGIVLERLILRRLAGNVQGQVLVTLGISFIIADLCLLIWTGDPMPLPAPQNCGRRCALSASRSRPTAWWCSASRWSRRSALYLLMERTRLGAMIRAGVDDMEMARGVGIPVSRLFTMVFLLGAALAGIGGVLGGADAQRLSGPRRRHAAARAHRRDPRRRGQPARRLRRQLHRRLSL